MLRYLTPAAIAIVCGVGLAIGIADWPSWIVLPLAVLVVGLERLIRRWLGG